MEAFTNVFGTKIEHRPFFQTCLGVWRVARYENNELFEVYEQREFKTKKQCLRACLS